MYTENQLFGAQSLYKARKLSFLCIWAPITYDNPVAFMASLELFDEIIAWTYWTETNEDGN